MQTKYTSRPRGGVLSRPLLSFSGALALATVALSAVPAASAEDLNNSSLYNPDAEYLVWKIEQAPAEFYAQVEQGGPAPTPEDKAELLKFFDNQYRQWHVKYAEYFTANYPKVNHEGFKQSYGALRDIFLDLSRTKDWEYSNGNYKFIADDLVKAIVPAVGPVAERYYNHFVQYLLNYHLSSPEPNWDRLNNYQSPYGGKFTVLTDIDKNFRPELTDELTKYGTYAKSLLDDYKKYVGDLSVEKKNQVVWFLTTAQLYAKMTQAYSHLLNGFRYIANRAKDTVTGDQFKLADYGKVVLAGKPVAEYTLPNADEAIGKRRLNRAEMGIVGADLSLLELVNTNERFREFSEGANLIFVALPSYPANCQLSDTACMEEALVSEAKKVKRLYNFWYAGQTYGNIFAELYWSDLNNPTNPAARIKYYVDLYNGKATK